MLSKRPVAFRVAPQPRPTVALAAVLSRATVFTAGLRQFRDALRAMNITGDSSRGIYRGYCDYRGLVEFTQIMNELIKDSGLDPIPLQNKSDMDNDQVVSDEFVQRVTQSRHDLLLLRRMIILVVQEL